MRKIFIDANIYLVFYNSNKPEFRKLLKALIELGDTIIVPIQIIDEVNRNKLNVFKDSIDNYVRQANISSTLLPVHLDNDQEPKIKTWNENRKKLEEQAAQLNKELSEIINQTITEVAISKDNVSIELQKVFARPLKPQENSFKRAKNRKELGNPPGKNSDPIGDQVNWIQILENLKDVSALWIVTNDTDYFTEYDKKLFLNPLLYYELNSINPGIEVYVFNKLSDALREFNEQEKVQSLPPEKELKIISMEEPELRVNLIALKPDIKFYGGGHAIPIKCVFCGEKDSYKDGGYRPSQYGGLTYQYICSKCNHFFDTGDFWD